MRAVIIASSGIEMTDFSPVILRYRDADGKFHSGPMSWRVIRSSAAEEDLLVELLNQVSGKRIGAVPVLGKMKLTKGTIIDVDDVAFSPTFERGPR